MLRDERIALAFLLLLSTVGAVECLVFHFIPGVDLPNHLAVATIIRFAGEAGNSFTDFFHIQAFLRPCVLHPAFCSLPFWPSVEFANQLLLAAYSLSLPLMVALIVRRVGGSIWLALFSLLLVHNFNMSWGFVGFTMAIPVVLFIVCQMLTYMSNPTCPRAIGLSALCVGLYAVHVLALLFVFLLLAVTTVVVFGRDLRRLLWSAMIALPSGLIVVWWWWQQPTYGNSTLDYLLGYYAGPFLSFLSQRPFELLTLDNYFLFRAEQGIVAAAASAGAIILAAGFGVALGWKGRGERLRSVDGRVLLSFLAVSVLCFALLPHKLPGEPYVYQRFSSLALIGLLCMGAFLMQRRTPVTVRWLAVVVATVSVILWADYVREFNRDNRAFAPDIFAGIDPNQPVAAMVFDDEFRGQPLYMQYPNYHTIWNRGIVTTAICDYRFGLIRRKVGRDVLPIFNPTIGHFPRSFNPADINTPYILTRGAAPPPVRSSLSRIPVLRQADEWIVYRR